MAELDIPQKANKLLLESGCAGIFPAPVEKIAKYLKFDCYYFNLDATTMNILGAVNHSNKRIYINPNESPQIQQFTVAHEIGHIILHGEDQDHIDYRDLTKSRDPREMDSDLFAENLLMPADMFIYQWKRLDKNYEYLSAFFGVTIPTIASRASYLHLN